MISGESSPTPGPNRQHDPMGGQRMVVCQGEAFAVAIMLEPHVRCVDAKRSLYASMMMKDDDEHEQWMMNDDDDESGKTL